jgi:hypothetical protein
MALGSTDRSFDPKTSVFTLHKAINLAAGGWGISGLSQWTIQDIADHTLCDRGTRIAVGPHRPNIPLMLYSDALGKAKANSTKNK